jgi:hypothetical protein
MSAENSVRASLRRRLQPAPAEVAGKFAAGSESLGGATATARKSRLDPAAPKYYQGRGRSHVCRVD